MTKEIYVVGTALGLAGTLGFGAVVGRRLLYPRPYEARVMVLTSIASEVTLVADRDSRQPGTYRLRRATESVRIGSILGETSTTVRREASGPVAEGEWDWDALMYDSAAEVLAARGPTTTVTTHVVHVHGQSLGPRQVLRGLPVWERLGARSEILDLTGFPERSFDPRAVEEIVHRIIAARQAGATRVVLQGWSAGALACSVAASRAKVDAVIGISPLLSIRSALRGAVSAVHLPRFVGNVAHRVLITPGFCLVAGAPEPVHPDHWMSGFDGPTLLLHSRADSLVSADDVEKLSERPNVQAVEFQTAPHTLEWNENPQRWDGLIEDFALRHSLGG